MTTSRFALIIVNDNSGHDGEIKGDKNNTFGFPEEVLILKSLMQALGFDVFFLKNIRVKTKEEENPKVPNDEKTNVLNTDTVSNVTNDKNENIKIVHESKSLIFQNTDDLQKFQKRREDCIVNKECKVLTFFIYVGQGITFQHYKEIFIIPNESSPKTTYVIPQRVFNDIIPGGENHYFFCCDQTNLPESKCMYDNILNVKKSKSTNVGENYYYYSSLYNENNTNQYTSTIYLYLLTSGLIDCIDNPKNHLRDVFPYTKRGYMKEFDIEFVKPNNYQKESKLNELIDILSKLKFPKIVELRSKEIEVKYDQAKVTIEKRLQNDKGELRRILRERKLIEEKFYEFKSSVLVGKNHSVYLSDNEVVSSFGMGKYGELGQNKITSQKSPKPIEYFTKKKKDIVKVVCGPFSTFFYSTEKEWFCCGLNSFYQLGLGNKQNQMEPCLHEFLSSKRVIGMHLGEYFSLFNIKEGNKRVLYGSGRTEYLGVNQMGKFAKIPQEIPLQFGVKRIMGGGDFTIILTHESDLFSTGKNESGQCALAKYSPYSLEWKEITCFNSEESKIDIQNIECGFSSSYFLTENNNVYSCGNNFYGQLGLNDRKNRNLPTQVKGITNIEKIYAGHGHFVFFVCKEGQIWGCGDNSQNVLSTKHAKHNNKNFEVDVPTKVINDHERIIHIEVGGSHSFFETENGMICGRGKNVRRFKVTKKTKAMEYFEWEQRISPLINSLKKEKTIYQSNFSRSLSYFERKNQRIHIYFERKITQIKQLLEDISKPFRTKSFLSLVLGDFTIYKQEYELRKNNLKAKFKEIKDDEMFLLASWKTLKELRCLENNFITRIKILKGVMYVGKWKNNEFHGNGELVLNEDVRYKGNFKEGKLNGNGSVSKFKDTRFSKTFEGEWKNGLKEGVGKKFDLYENPMFIGFWKNDTLFFIKKDEQDMKEGGMAKVYKYNLGKRIVALKVKKANAPYDVRKEAKTILSFQHENIVKCFGYNYKKGIVVLEWCNRGDLLNFMYKNSLSFSENVDLLYQVAKGMEYMHSCRQIHRDMKLANCLVKEVNGKNVVKITDFGTAKELKKFSKGVTSLTMNDTVITEYYVPPEIYIGYKELKAERNPNLSAEKFNNGVYQNLRKRYSPSGDVFGFGIMVLRSYFNIFTGIETSTHIYRTFEELEDSTWKPSPPERKIPKEEKWLVDLMYRCCMWDPLERPTSREILNCFKKNVNDNTNND